MKTPTDGTKIHDHPLATLWFDKDGILHKISKNTPRTPENVKDLYTLIKRTTKGKKVCALIEVSEETVSNKEIREYLKKEIPQVFSAVAFVSVTPLGQMIGTLTSVLTPMQVATNVFKKEEDARKWLKEKNRLY